jgi:RNA polymerase-interacting CarD/CdnL/TRCF family regulator
MSNTQTSTDRFHFRVGDTVVEPSIGICSVEGIRRMTIDGIEEDFYVFNSAQARVMVPRSQLQRRGIRKPMSKDDVKKLYATLRMPVSPVRGDARQMYLNYRDIIKSGDPGKICRLVRDLHVLDQMDELKGKEKEIMEQAISFLVEEILFVTQESKTKIRQDIDESLTKMFKKRQDKEAKKAKDSDDEEDSEGDSGDADIDLDEEE